MLKLKKKSIKKVSFQINKLILVYKKDFLKNFKKLTIIEEYTFIKDKIEN